MKTNKMKTKLSLILILILFPLCVFSEIDTQSTPHENLDTTGSMGLIGTIIVSIIATIIGGLLERSVGWIKKILIYFQNKKKIIFSDFTQTLLESNITSAFSILESSLKNIIEAEGEKPPAELVCRMSLFYENERYAKNNKYARNNKPGELLPYLSCEKGRNEGLVFRYHEHKGTLPSRTKYKKGQLHVGRCFMGEKVCVYVLSDAAMTAITKTNNSGERDMSEYVKAWQRNHDNRDLTKEEEMLLAAHSTASLIHSGIRIWNKRDAPFVLCFDVTSIHCSIEDENKQKYWQEKIKKMLVEKHDSINNMLSPYCSTFTSNKTKYETLNQ